MFQLETAAVVMTDTSFRGFLVPHYLIKDPVSGGMGNIFNVKGKSKILILSTTLKHFPILRRTIESFLYLHTALHIKYAMFLSDFNQT
jgi:hypothetical protein